ncbi:MAG: NAD(P)-dependent oxidoreductase [Gammaproteobacteria bacterium]|nr:MAG: NAD(P)-dependent oxidoreductase [Gammaproteobacteria bacterium]
MKTISLLGSGWLGLPLAKHFVSKGFVVKASTRSESRLAGLRDNNTEAFLVDIDRLDDNIEGFLHTDSLVINITSKNTDGFRLLVEEIERSTIKNLIFISSTSVYVNTNKIIREDDVGSFSNSPLLAIEALFRHAVGFNTTIIRFGGLIGYSRHPGRFFKQGKVFSYPDAYVNLIHRDDCIEIISRVIEQQAWGEVFNCCADTHPTKREFYTQASKAMGATVPRFSESDEVSYKIISNQKVKAVLGYEFLHADLMALEFERDDE